MTFSTATSSLSRPRQAGRRPPLIGAGGVLDQLEQRPEACCASSSPTASPRSRSPGCWWRRWCPPPTCTPETGFDLWLRYHALASRRCARSSRRSRRCRRPPAPTHDVTVRELRRGLGLAVGVDVQTAAEVRDGALVLGTPASSPASPPSAGARRCAARRRRLRDPQDAGRRTPRDGDRVAGETGVLYGAFHFLRLIQTGRRSRARACPRARGLSAGC